MRKSIVSHYINKVALITLLTGSLVYHVTEAFKEKNDELVNSSKQLYSSEIITKHLPLSNFTFIVFRKK